MKVVKSCFTIWFVTLHAFLFVNSVSAFDLKKPLDEKRKKLYELSFSAEINEPGINELMEIIENPKDLERQLLGLFKEKGHGRIVFFHSQEVFGTIYLPRRLYVDFTNSMAQTSVKAEKVIKEELAKAQIVDPTIISKTLRERLKGTAWRIAERQIAEAPDKRIAVLFLAGMMTRKWGEGVLQPCTDDETLRLTREEFTALQEKRRAEEFAENVRMALKRHGSLGITGLLVSGISDFSKIDESKHITAVRNLARKSIKNGYYVYDILAGTPADRSEFKKNDVIVGVGGELFETPNDMEASIGHAIELAEKTNGTLVFQVKRLSDSAAVPYEVMTTGESVDVAVKVPQAGGFLPTIPQGCQKSAALADKLAQYVLKNEIPHRGQYFTSLYMLSLLAVGDPAFDQHVGNNVMRLAPDGDSCRSTPGCTWTHTGATLALCEYFLRTNDEKVLPAIRNLHKILRDGQSDYYGSGHRCRGGDYRSSGFNITAGHALLCFALIKECGVPVDEAALAKSLTRLKSCTKHGSLGYAGVHAEFLENPFFYRYQGSRGTSSRGGVTSIAARLLGDEGYADALLRGIRHESGSKSSRYQDFLNNHGSKYMGMFWGLLALSGADEAAHSEALYEHVWHLQLSRQPNKEYLVSYNGDNDRNDDLYLNALYLLSLNAHKHNLYVTGRKWWKPGFQVPLVPKNDEIPSDQ